MIIDCSVDVNFDIVFGEGLLSVQIDNVGLHIHDMDSVSEGVEVLKTRPHRLDIFSKSFVYP